MKQEKRDGIEEIEYIDETEYIDGIEDIEEIDEIEYIDGIEDVEEIDGTEYIDEIENIEDIDETEYVDGIEDIEEIYEIEETEVIDEIEEESKEGEKRAGIFPKILPVITALLSIAILVLLWKITDYLIDEHKSLDFWDDLQNSVVVANEDGQDGETKEGEPETEEIVIPAFIDFDSLYMISEDVVAWLLSPGTKLNYVIAQAEDNDYYLRRLLNGTSASGGTLFEDCRNSADFTDWNTIVYGHNMKNGTMFAELMNYRNPSYYEEHPVMYLYLPGKRYKLELVAGYTTNVDDIIFSAPATKEERDAIFNHASRVSSFISGITLDAQDKLVTLSTCSYAYDDARYVVIGRIVED